MPTFEGAKKKTDIVNTTSPKVLVLGKDTRQEVEQIVRDLARSDLWSSLDAPQKGKAIEVLINK
jgi:hypothetical protein